MKKYTIDEVCKELGISRQMLNVKCRKMKIEKVKVGRRSYISTQQLKVLKGSKTSATQKHSHTRTAGDSVSVDERLIERLVEENEYLKKKLDEEGDKVKGSLNVIFQQTERITKLETDNNRLLSYAPKDEVMENMETTSEPVNVNIDKEYYNKTLHEKREQAKKAPWYEWWINPRGKGRRFGKD